MKIGNIKKRKDGLFEARYTFNGSQKSIYGKAEKEVREKLKKILAEVELGTYREPCKMKYSEWLDTWLWEYKHDKIAEKTFEQYEMIIRLHIKPHLGHYKLEELETIDIQKVINSMEKTRTTQLTCSVIRMTLAHARRLNITPKNVGEYIITPKVKDPLVKPLNAEEYKIIIKSTFEHRLGIAFYFLLATGMRVGELLALTWEDVDLVGKTVNVSKSLKRSRVYNKDKTYSYKTVTGNTKTKKGKRTLPLPDNAVVKLRYHAHRQRIERAKASTWEKNDLVFCSRTGKIISPRNFTKYFSQFLTRLNIPHKRIHQLRHTFATIGLENGIDIKVMQELLGHSSLFVTSEIYSHVMPDKKRKEMEKVNKIL
jgi:integrase